MLGEGGTPLSRLQAVVHEFLARDEREVDLGEYRSVIDSGEGDFSSVARDAQKSGANLVGGNITAASWIARTCDMSVNSAAERLCVGEQLESLPKVAGAPWGPRMGGGSKRGGAGEGREVRDTARRSWLFDRDTSSISPRHVADPDGVFDE